MPDNYQTVNVYGRNFGNVKKIYLYSQGTFCKGKRWNKGRVVI